MHEASPITNNGILTRVLSAHSKTRKSYVPQKQKTKQGDSTYKLVYEKINI
jgi:hypothetical protein